MTNQLTGSPIQSAIAQVVDGPNANRAIITDADGAYSLVGLSAGDFTLRIAATGFMSASQAVTLRSDTRLNVALQSAVATLSGTVTDGTSGGILPDILVKMLDTANAGKLARTDSVGSYVIAGITPGTFSVSASAASYVTVLKEVTAPGSTRVDFVLPRIPSPIVATPGPPAPVPGTAPVPVPAPVPAPQPIPAPVPAPAPVATRSVTIGFTGIGGNGTAFANTTESGYTVASTLGNWTVSTSYGNPAPFIQFTSPGACCVPLGVPVTAEVRITGGGAPFRFSAVDFYSSVTSFTYAFTGLRNSATVFAVSDGLPNPRGGFLRATNPHATDVIDTLLIKLSDPIGGNPVGLDNITITY